MLLIQNDSIEGGFDILTYGAEPEFIQWPINAVNGTGLL
jgi:hypothetical protein